MGLAKGMDTPYMLRLQNSDFTSPTSHLLRRDPIPLEQPTRVVGGRVEAKVETADRATLHKLRDRVLPHLPNVETAKCRYRI